MSSSHQLRQWFKEAQASLGGPSKFRVNYASTTDFLERVIDDSDDAYSFATKVVQYFSLDDDQVFNGCIAGIALAVLFLTRVHPVVSDNEQVTAGRDLKRLVEDGTATADQIRHWAEAHFR
jgi:hypothetical protein